MNVTYIIWGDVGMYLVVSSFMSPLLWRIGLPLNLPVVELHKSINIKSNHKRNLCTLNVSVNKYLTELKTSSNLRQDWDLWFKVYVIIYNVCLVIAIKFINMKRHVLHVVCNRLVNFVNCNCKKYYWWNGWVFKFC